MSLTTAFKILFDIALVVLILAGYLNEDKLIAFEKKAVKRLSELFKSLLKNFRKSRLCKEINRMICAYEMAHTEVRK